jgi:general secretion pathway protein L
MLPIQTTVGIDITESDLRIEVVQSRFGKSRLVSSQEIAGFAELSENAQQAAIADLAGNYGLGRARVFLTIPRRFGLSRQIELPVEVGNQLGSAVALQIESLSPWPSEEVYWGYAAEQAKRDAKTISVLVGIIPRSVLDPYLSSFKSAGVLLSGATLSGVPQVNVIPALDRYRRDHVRLAPTYALVTLVLLMGAALVLREPYQWSVYGASLQSEIDALKPEVAEVSAREDELAKASADYEALRSRIETYDSNLEALRALARFLPPDCWISAYNAQGRNVTLSGFAQSASAVQKALEESPLFEDVQFSSNVMRDATGKDRFSIKAILGATP